MLRLALLSIFLLLASCSQFKPLCKIEPSHYDPRSANAGCFIRSGNRLLVVRELSGKLAFPAGSSEVGEIAQCTAARETWEEAGVNVIVGRLVMTFPNGFRLYECIPQDTGVYLSPVLRDWAKDEIAEVLWVNPLQIQAEQWRYPDQWQLVQSQFFVHTR